MTSIILFQLIFISKFFNNFLIIIAKQADFKRNFPTNNNTRAAKTEKQINGLVENLIIHTNTSRVSKRGPLYIASY